MDDLSLGLIQRLSLFSEISVFVSFILFLLFSCSVLSSTLWTRGLQHTRLPCSSVSPEVCIATEAMLPFNYLIFCFPLLLPSVFLSIRVFSSELALHISWPKYWSFSFSISLSDEYSGLISFRIDWLDLFAVQRTLKSLLQHHSSKASVVQCSAFFMIQSHIQTWLLEKPWLWPYRSLLQSNVSAFEYAV